MTETQNLHLPQWEAEDRIMRTDFNDAMASIDAGVAANAAALLGKGNCQIEVQTYTGTGEHGADNPTCITFRAKPKVFFIFGNNSLLFGGEHSTNKVYASTSSGNGLTAPGAQCAWDGNQIRLWSTNSSYGAAYQCNVTNVTYCVVAFYAQDE